MKIPPFFRFGFVELNKTKIIGLILLGFNGISTIFLTSRKWSTTDCWLNVFRAQRADKKHIPKVTGYMLMSNTVIAFLMTLAAGLATGIGSCIAFFCKRTGKTFMAVSLGFSAGVMIYVSFAEIFAKAQDSLFTLYGSGGAWIAVGAFFGGVLFMAIVDKLIPSPEKADSNGPTEAKGMMRTGVLTALAIAVHNFPEGIATFASSLGGIDAAVPIVVAIAVHNIPEGIAVSVPLYKATGSRKKAFLLSFLSGLAEPVGALIGWAILAPIMSDTVLCTINAAVAGLMIYISVDELLPTAFSNGKFATLGVVTGMAIMAVSLILFL